MKHTNVTRRLFTLGVLASTGALAACNNGVGSPGATVIDARVEATLAQMQREYPNTVDLVEKSNGMLVMPLVTEAGFGFGGSYGRGALVIDGAPVDYYSATEVSGGLQVGAQQFAHVLFFMTEDALRDFRASPGWAIGGDVQYVISDIGDGFKADTTTALSPVLAAVFGRAGLMIGATLQGTKYNRIVP